MQVVAIVQARTGSERLPGKVLKTLGGKPVVLHVLDRLRRTRLVDGLVLATTDRAQDDPLADLAREGEGVLVFRGSEDDVLERYALAAQAAAADIVVRVTSDCPLIDPRVVDAGVDLLLRSLPDCDYVSNTLERTFPRGLDTEVFTRAALERAHEEARDPYEREHVTPFIWRRPERFRIRQLHSDTDASDGRWTLDTEEDLEFLGRVFDALGAGATEATWTDVLALLAAHPEWEAINAQVRQKGEE